MITWVATLIAGATSTVQVQCTPNREMVLRQNGVELVVSSTSVIAKAASAEVSPSNPEPLSAKFFDYELTWDGELRLKQDAGEQVVPLPKLMRRGSWQVLNASDDALWLASSGGVVRVDVANFSAATATIGATRAPVFFERWTPEQIYLVNGNAGFVCDVKARCRKRLNFPVSVQLWLLGHNDALFAGNNGKASGLYRYNLATGTMALLYQGEVLGGCVVEEDSLWIAQRTSAGVAVVISSPGTPAFREYNRIELLERALVESKSDISTLVEILERSQSGAWTERHELARMALSNGAPGVRFKAGQILTDGENSQLFEDLSILANDSSSAVRGLGINAFSDRCSVEKNTNCETMLRRFVRDPVVEISETARTALLEYDVAAALEGASDDYKLQMIAVMVARSQKDAPKNARQLFTLLSGDKSDAVREAALIALSAQQPWN